MRLKGGVFAEFCLGAGAVLLLAAAFFYFVSPSAKRAEDPAVRGAEFEKRYEILLREINDLENSMVVREDENKGGRWITREEPDAEDEMCGFTAGVWKKSDDVSLHASVSFVRSEDVLVERIFLLADGEEYELFLGNAKRETEALAGENTGEKIEIPEGDCFQQLEQAVKSEKIAVRFQGADEPFYAQLTETQVRNLKSVLRFFELSREAWALGALRGAR